MLAAAVIAAAMYAGLQIYLHHAVDRHLQAAVRTTPELTDIRYGHMDVSLLPFGVELRNVELVTAGGARPIPIRRVNLNRFTAGRVLPEHLALSLYGARIHHTHPAAGPIDNLMQRLAMDTLDIDIHIRLVKDPVQENAWCGHVELHVRPAGILRLALAVDHLDEDGMARALDNPLNWLAVLPPVGIRAAALEFEEGGLVTRIISDRARRSGLTPAAARRRIGQEIETAARRKKILPLGHLLSAFVSDPVRIGYYTGNVTPVYMGRLMWSRRVRDWLRPLQVRGALASAPRNVPWMTTAAAIPGKPPHP